MGDTKSQDEPRPKMSLLSYLSSEVTRGYVLDHDEERYTTRRQKMYTFMKIPRELEKFMSYGFFHCLDSFLFVFTFLPIRFVLALGALIVRAPLASLGLIRPFHGRLLFPAEKIDLLKGLIIGVCAYVMSHIDTSMMYHLIKSQSVIKLYLFYNMLEVSDRLFSAFGQDTIDALFWTATEPTLRKREHIGVIPHFLLTITYVILHTMLVLLQATTLNVAINASNKALLTIMMSNNFVELKGSVFKKFDKNNLFQVSCCDVRERFHLFSLLFIVVVQTMKEYGWREESFWSLAPDCLLVLGAEFLVDWIKHAFITRFNEVSAEVYKDYTTYLAYDLAQTKQKHAFSDHSDIVSRRMGFIPLPLGVVMIRVITNAVRGNSRGAPVIFLLAYLCLVTFRILASIVILGKACDLIDHHQQTKTTPTKKQKKSDQGTSDDKESTNTEEVQPSSQMPTYGKIPPDPDPNQSTGAAADEFIEEVGSQPFNVSLEENLDIEDEVPPRLSLSPCPPHGLVERLEALSKSSSVILEEEEFETGTETRTRSLATESSISEDEGEDRKSSGQHRWSNSRSKYFVVRGELNKSVYSDSRKRPLSCTPPSTSLSTSVSVDDEEEHKHHIPPDEIATSNDVDRSNESSMNSHPIFLPDLVQSGGHLVTRQDDVVNVGSELICSETVPVLQTEQKSEKQKLDSAPSLEFPLFESTIGQRSMSSPDFLHQYQQPFDAERDWPQVESEDYSQDLELEKLNQEIIIRPEPCRPAVDDQAVFKFVATSRRGSGSATDENRGGMRNRKRFETDRF